jgi:hypothetical protein
MQPPFRQVKMHHHFYTQVSFRRKWFGGSKHRKGFLTHRDTTRDMIDSDCALPMFEVPCLFSLKGVFRRAGLHFSFEIRGFSVAPSAKLSLSICAMGWRFSGRPFAKPALFATQLLLLVVRLATCTYSSRRMRIGTRNVYHTSETSQH